MITLSTKMWYIQMKRTSFYYKNQPKWKDYHINYLKMRRGSLSFIKLRQEVKRIHGEVAVDEGRRWVGSGGGSLIFWDGPEGGTGPFGNFPNTSFCWSVAVPFITSTGLASAELLENPKTSTAITRIADSRNGENFIFLEFFFFFLNSDYNFCSCKRDFK